MLATDKVRGRGLSTCTFKLFAIKNRRSQERVFVLREDTGTFFPLMETQEKTVCLLSVKEKKKG